MGDGDVHREQERIDRSRGAANAAGLAGRVDEAISCLRALLIDAAATLGAAHGLTLIMRSDLAHWLARTGRSDLAVEQLEALVTDCDRALGSDTRVSLTARHNLAYYVGDLGQYRRSLELF